jgi:hypothetical protein
MPQRALVAALIGALVVWLGATFFFSLVVLPSLFINLERAQAGAVAALLFPLYYRVGTAAGVVALLTALLLARGAGLVWRAATLTITVMLACQLYSTFVLHPRVAALRGDAAHSAEFEALHRRSVRYNGIVLFGGLALIGASGLLFDKR